MEDKLDESQSGTEQGVSEVEITRKVELLEVDIDQLESNVFSANEEDDSTFTRLQDEIKRRGLIELPVVTKKDENRYTIIAGHHRVNALRSLGVKRVPVVLYKGRIETREDMFNLVNNMNLIRGTIRKSELIRKIREFDLDPTKLDLHKNPWTLLVPKVTEEDIARRDAEAMRNAKIQDMALKIAKEIAKTLIMEKDEFLTFIVVHDRPAAVIRIPFKSMKMARDRSVEIKKRIESALADIREIAAEMEEEE
ncbi:MAG: ParB/RepB/Spo0J family partition protein [Methanothrix sp.]|nr:ParB/RepB/Spo0J family partition protein [Methanothrix sp.]